MTATDAADSQSDFQVQVTTNPSDQLKAAASYTVTCTPPPPQTQKIKIKKVKDPASDPGADNPDFKFNVDGSSAATLKVGDESEIGVTAGSHSVEEVGPLPANWTLTGVSCGDNQTPATVSVPAGQTITCTFTNKYTAPPQTQKIKIKKVKDPASDPGANNPDFNFNVDGSLAATLKVGDESEIGVAAGSHSVEEVGPLPANWTLTGVSCGDNQTPATVNVPSGQTITCTFTNKYTAPPPPQTKVILRKVTTDGSTADFTFASSIGAFNNLTLTTAGGSAIAGPTTVTGGIQQTITEQTNPDYTLQSASCALTNGGGAPANGGGNLSNGTLTFTPATGEQVTCTFTNKKVKDDKAHDETKRFINRRVDNLLSHDPDRARMLRRLGEQERPQSLKDGPLKFSGDQLAGYQVSAGGGAMSASGGTMSFGSPMSLGGTANSPMAFGDDASLPWVRGPFDTDDQSTFGYQKGTQGPASGSLLASFAGQLAPLANGATSLKFGTSLSEIRAKAAEAEAQEQQKKLQDAGLSFTGQLYGDPDKALRQGLDFWVEGQISRYNDGAGGVNRDGDFRILYVGADYVLAPYFLVGALVQIDDTNEDLDDSTQTGKISGTGWMVGPYAGVKLLDNLFLDVRAAWGRSNNDIWLNDAVDGFRTGSFDTERWLATATLTGVHNYGAWRFSPQVGLAYGHESFETYTTSAGQIVTGDDANIGRLTGGVEVGYRMQARYGLIVEPHVALNGIWNFDSDDLIINGVQTETKETRAEVEGGIMVTTQSGWSLRAAGRYDGIGGSDFESYGGSLWVNVPLHRD